MSKKGTARLAAVAAVVAGCLLITGDPSMALDCGAGVDGDIDGDGVEDVVIGDPNATVGSVEAAGRIHIVFGGGGSQTISQVDIPFMGPERGDRFGFSLATVDWNGDGCSDVIAGTPFEADGTDTESGTVIMIPGGPSGAAADGAIAWQQGLAGIPGARQIGARFGYSVAAGTTEAGEPYVVAGAPGADAGSVPKAGTVSYIRPSVKSTFHQDSPGVFGIAETGDMFGYAVAATNGHIAVGGPGEAVGEFAYSGTVGVFSHAITNGVPTSIGGVDQEQDGDSGIAEPNDWFGRSLSMVDYIPVGGTVSDTAALLAIGSPGEALGASSSAGRIVTVEADGTITEVASINQGNAGVDGDVEPDDYFGWSLGVANLHPDQPVTWDSLLLAVGVPGEDVAPHVDQGGVQLFSMVGPPGDHDMWASDVLTVAGRAPEGGSSLGQVIRTTATHLIVGDPSALAPAVYVIPWTSVLAGIGDGIVVHRPGQNGLPVDGVGAFGAAIA